MTEQEMLREKRFTVACFRLEGRSLGFFDEADSLTVYNALNRQYSDPARHYHNWAHIDHCLEELDKVPYVMIKDAAELIELVIFFHDSVYVIGAPDNEEQSVDFAVQSGMVVSRPTIDLFRQLILATKHDGRSQTGYERLLCDVDLAILGQSSTQFDEYEKQIRQEYGIVPDEVFLPKRVGFLEQMRKRRIYQTDFFALKYERIALANMSRSIVLLKETMKQKGIEYENK